MTMKKKIGLLCMVLLMCGACSTTKPNNVQVNTQNQKPYTVMHLEDITSTPSVNAKYSRFIVDARTNCLYLHKGGGESFFAPVKYSKEYDVCGQDLIDDYFSK